MARAHHDVTIRDVAKHAGVSVKTVSRVLNNEPFVRDSTRSLVVASIQQLGFVTNLSARRLATGQSYTIALIFHDASWLYYLNVERAVLRMAGEAGYSMLLHACDATNQCDSQVIRQMVQQRVVDGFVFTPPADNAVELLESLSEQGVPFVRLTPADRDRPWPFVTATDVEGTRDMVRYLASLGHRRIGFVIGPMHQRAARDRLVGYREGLAEAGIEFDAGLTCPGDDSFEAGMRACRKLLERQPRPSVIFANNDEMAIGAMHAAQEAGLDIPGDLSIAGFDDVPLARQVWPPLTTVHQPIVEIAELATELLLRMLNGEKPTTYGHEIPTHLVIRQSTGAPRGGTSDQNQ